MCKFVKPQIPADATADERRSIMFDALSSLDLSDKVEKRENLTYLSWSNAWSEFKYAYPSATYRIVKNPNTGLPYFTDPNVGIIVFTEVTVDDVTHEMFLPVMNQANRAMKLEPYTYQVYDNYRKQYVEKTVNSASMFDVNKTIMRCLVKNLAMFGLGLYIYSGEDVPGTTDDSGASAATPVTQKPVDRFASIKNAINQATDIPTLMSLYLDHQNEVEANPQIKELFTTKRVQLQSMRK